MLSGVSHESFQNTHRSLRIALCRTFSGLICYTVLGLYPPTVGGSLLLRHLRCFCILSVFLLLLVVLPNGTWATAWTILADGSGDFPTLQQAVEQAESGDTFLVGSGEHRGPFWIETKNLVIRSLEGPEATILRGSPDVGSGWDPVVHFFYEAEIGSVIEGFTIQHGESGIRCTGASPIIRGNVIQENAGPLGSGISCNFGSAPLIENNLVWRNHTVSGCCFPSRGAGIYADDTSPAEIRGNIVAFNHCVDQCAGGGISAFIGRVEGNTVFGNRADGPGGGVELTGSDLELTGNIIVGNRSGEFADGVMVLRDAVLRCNDIWGNGDEDYWGADPGEGDFSADPRFCGIPSIDADRLVSVKAELFNLRSDSPCLPGQHPDGFECGVVGARPEGCVHETKPPAVAAPAPRPALQVSPNPTRGGVLIQSFDTGIASKQATLEIMDASGRVVRRLESSLSGGVYWDGGNAAGDPVATGLYFVRVHSAGSRPSMGTVLVIR